MRLVITEKQLRDIVRRRFPNQEISEEGDAAAAAPEAGTSSDGNTKTGMSRWESGVTRGPANQVGVTKWAEVVGSKLTRGHANQLKEQEEPLLWNKGEEIRIERERKTKEEIKYLKSINLDKLFVQEKDDMLGTFMEFLDDKKIDFLENSLNDMNNELQPLKEFILELLIDM